MWTCLRTSPELFDICWYILIWHDIFEYIWARVATCCTVCKVLRVTKLHVLPRRVSQNVAESCHLKHLGTSFVVSCFYFRVIQVQNDAILVFFSCRQMLQMQPWWQPCLQMLQMSPQGTIEVMMFDARITHNYSYHTISHYIISHYIAWHGMWWYHFLTRVTTHQVMCKRYFLTMEPFPVFEHCKIMQSGLSGEMTWPHC